MRQLVRYGDSNIFEYGADGIRCKKNNITYALNGSRILKENRGNISLTYYYGMSGVIGFQYDDEDYFYQKNLQGDITAIYNSYGALVAEYKYDAWGKVLAVVNHTSANIGTINPFRYRGYYYDTETGLYYLQTRYYDPETGRFINADDLAYLGADESLSSYNLYAYCANNPVMHSDDTGRFVITGSALLFGIAIGAIIGALTSFGATVYKDFSDDGEIFNGSVGVDEYIGNTLGGAIAGAGIGLCTTLGAGVGAAMLMNETLVIGGLALSGSSAMAIGTGAAFVTGGLGYTVRTAINRKEPFEISDMLIEAGANTASGMISFVGGMCGGIAGVKIPGKFIFNDSVKYHLGMAWFGVYPAKFFISKIKQALKERY